MIFNCSGDTILCLHGNKIRRVLFFEVLIFAFKKNVRIVVNFRFYTMLAFLDWFWLLLGQIERRFNGFGEIAKNPR